ncbi:MAG: 6-phospho-beta-glucosidase, partial [Acidobacteria bacterium]|nr:6-phospho-beta-glucosidase [Acidobacteriota bacterium]
MRVALLGGGGLRSPLLARALAGSGLGVRELALYDADPGRLAAIAPVVAASAPGARVRVSPPPAAAVRQSRLVFASHPAGGPA